MAATNLDICNTALYRLGATAITALDEDSDAARLLNQNYELRRKSTLRAHPWRCATKYVLSLAYDLPAATLTPGAGATVVGTLAVTFTASAGVFTTADVGKRLWNAAGVGKATITGFTSDTVVTATVTESFPGLTAIASQSWKRYNAAPPHTYQHQHARPSDWLRWLDTPQPSWPFKPVGVVLYSDSDELELAYVYDLSDVTLFDALFEDAFVSAIALEIAYPVTGTRGVVDDMKQAYANSLGAARAADGQEGSPDVWESTELIDVRMTGVLPRTGLWPR